MLFVFSFLKTIVWSPKLILKRSLCCCFFHSHMIFCTKIYVLKISHVYEKIWNSFKLYDFILETSIFANKNRNNIHFVFSYSFKIFFFYCLKKQKWRNYFKKTIKCFVLSKMFVLIKMFCIKQNVYFNKNVLY